MCSKAGVFAFLVPNARDIGTQDFGDAVVTKARKGKRCTNVLVRGRL